MKRAFLAVIMVLAAVAAFSQAKDRVIIPESCLEFKANDDYTEVTITRINIDYRNRDKFEGKILEIPSAIQGIPVTQIGDNLDDVYNGVAVWWNGSGEGLYIPDGVKRIGIYAFSLCNFKTLRLPEGLEVIRNDTFYHNESLTSVNIPSTVKRIEAGAFALCKNLSEITIPASVEYIGCSEEHDLSGAFYGSGIQKLVFEGKRIRLDAPCFFGSAFSNCDNLEQIEFPQDFAVLTDLHNIKKKITLADIITGKKISASFALQKKLKAVKVLDAKTEEERQKIEAAYKCNKLHTNLWFKPDEKTKAACIAIEEKKGNRIVSFIKEDSIFERVGLQLKDTIAGIKITKEDGSKSEIGYNEALNVLAPATLEFTVQRGNGKKAQTLTIEVPVEWNQSELRNILE